MKVFILFLEITVGQFLVPVFTASNGSSFLHSVDRLSVHLRTAIEDVRRDFDVDLQVFLTLTSTLAGVSEKTIGRKIDFLEKFIADYVDCIFT